MPAGMIYKINVRTSSYARLTLGERAKRAAL